MTLGTGTYGAATYGSTLAAGGGSPPPVTIQTAAGTLGLAADQLLQVEQRGTPSSGQWQVPLRLSPSQTATLLDAVCYPDAVVERPVPDGDSVVVDESGSSRQTITIDPPADAILPSDDYLVRDWTATPISHGTRRWQVGLTVADT